MSISQGIARVIVQRCGISPSQAYDMLARHREIIKDQTIITNAERIIHAEGLEMLHREMKAWSDSLDSEPANAGTMQHATTDTIQPETETPLQPVSDEAPTLRHYIQLGPNLIALESDDEVKQMKQQGYINNLAVGRSLASTLPKIFWLLPISNLSIFDADRRKTILRKIRIVNGHISFDPITELVSFMLISIHGFQLTVQVQLCFS